MPSAVLPSILHFTASLWPASTCGAETSVSAAGEGSVGAGVEVELTVVGVAKVGTDVAGTAFDGTGVAVGEMGVGVDGIDVALGTTGTAESASLSVIDRHRSSGSWMANWHTLSPSRTDLTISTVTDLPMAPSHCWRYQPDPQ